MKNTRKNMILIAISLGIIACVGIIMAMLVQNKSAATGLACPVHGTSFLTYTAVGGGKHKVECQSCSANLGTEDCTWTEYEEDGNVHSQKCEKNCGSTSSHLADYSLSYNAFDGVSGTHSKKCNGATDCTLVLSHTPNWSNNDGQCAYSGTDGTCNIQCDHNGATTGTCTICGKTLGITGHTHGKGTTLKGYQTVIVSGTIYHIPVYNCSGSTECEGYIDTDNKHVANLSNSVTDNGDGTHTGTCTVCGEEVTEKHDLQDFGYEKTATTHAKKRICITGTCSYIEVDTAEAHTGGTHSNGGKCTVCDYKYQNHEKGTITGYDITEENHTAKYGCTQAGCTETYTGTAEAHNFVNGTCTKCGATQSQQACTNHQITTGTDNGDGTHTGTCPNCNKPITEAHNFVNGTCTKCGATQSQQACTNHQITTGTDNGDGTHTGTCPNCNNPITEAHNFVNGTCTKCGATQSQQACTNHQITTGTDNGDGNHTGTCPNCNKPITEAHNFVNGTCTKCGATQGGSETCEHEFEMKYNDTMHWEKCKKCNEIRNNKKHTYIDGKCTVCNYECRHTSTTLKKDDTYHWNECNDCGKELNKQKHTYTNGKCSCGKTEDTEECTHTNKEWKYNTNQHWQECKDCGAEIEGTKGAHNYTNGKCICGKTSSIEEGCTHTNREWKSNATEHWQVCKDCGEEIEGTRGQHVNVDGKCKNCGLQEDSKSNTKIPNTGYKALAATLPIVLVLVVFGAIKMKKYKEI